MDTPALSYVRSLTVEAESTPTLQGTAADSDAWDAIFAELDIKSDIEPTSELDKQTSK